VKNYKSSEIKKYDKRPGMTGTFVHGGDVTLTHWTGEKGAILALHSHRHEQITYVISGKIRFEDKDGKPSIVEAGGFAVFAPNEVHGGEVLEQSVFVDAFSPAREDFKSELGWKD
jgi:quercetin dioxygenase-like cupin family protein